MNAQQAISVLRKHNEWRRTPAHTPEDSRPAQGNPSEIGIAIDVLCDEVERLHRVLATVKERLRADDPHDLYDLICDAIQSNDHSAGAGHTP